MRRKQPRRLRKSSRGMGEKSGECAMSTREGEMVVLGLVQVKSEEDGD